MLTRSTHTTLLQHPFPRFGGQALGTLHEGGLVLLPTANLWQVVAHAGRPEAVQKLLAVCSPGKTNRPELIFADVASLRADLPRINPTLDTLLYYHQRALTVLAPAGPRTPAALVNGHGMVAARIAMDSACYRICEDLSHPLVACLAVGRAGSELPTTFGKISSDILRAVDHVEQRRQEEVIGSTSVLVVAVGEDGELVFK